MYVGTYTGFKFVHRSKTYGVGESHSKGIYVSRFHADTGELGEAQLAAEMINPSFLTDLSQPSLSLRGERRPVFGGAAARSRVLCERICD